MLNKVQAVIDTVIMTGGNLSTDQWNEIYSLKLSLERMANQHPDLDATTDKGALGCSVISGIGPIKMVTSGVT